MEKTVSCIYTTSSSSSSWDQLEMVLILVLPVKQTSGPSAISHCCGGVVPCSSPQSSPTHWGGMRPQTGCAEPCRLCKPTACLKMDFFFLLLSGWRNSPATASCSSTPGCVGVWLPHCCSCRALGPPLELASVSCSALVPQ